MLAMLDLLYTNITFGDVSVTRIDDKMEKSVSQVFLNLFNITFDDVRMLEVLPKGCWQCLAKECQQGVLGSVRINKGLGVRCTV